MTEEIIIDGVNVAGCHNKTPYKNDYGDVQCKCYRFEDIENDTFLFGICKQHPNCYYKQLKRLEQENKELKAELNKVIDEREKKIEETLLKGCYQSLGSECRIYELKESKYRSALEEINLILDELKQQYDYMTDYAEIKEIQDKINEVLNG